MSNESKKREAAYNEYHIIPWNGEDITITTAATIYGYYFAEGNMTVCEKLQPLISEAKALIREHFPDQK